MIRRTSKYLMIASLISFAKTKLTGDTYDADHGSVDV